MAKAKKSEFLKGFGKMFEIVKMLVNAVLDIGGDDSDLERILKDADLRKEIAKLIVGAKSVACSFADLIPEGWTVVEDVAPSTFDVSKLKPASFLKQGESSIGGEEMRKRAIEFKGNLGLADGKRLLAEQEKIPAEFRKFYISLPGTVLRASGGGLCVPDLYFDGGRWVLGFSWIDGDWFDFARFACCE